MTPKSWRTVYTLAFVWHVLGTSLMSGMPMPSIAFYWPYLMKGQIPLMIMSTLTVL